MTKTVSVAELGHGGASRAIREARQEPVLVSKENRPAAWIISAEKLAGVAAARGAEASQVYERALELLAIELYRQAILTLGQASKLAAMPLYDFIGLCGRVQVPLLWEPEGGIQAEVEKLETLLTPSQSGR